MQSHLLFLASLAAVARAVVLPSALEPRATPKVYLCGDSTTAANGGGSGTQGWGEYLKYSLSLSIVNSAHAGTSARSYNTTGRFQNVINAVTKGDYVIIEFGHNDGGSLSTTDNLRTDCFGGGAETCISPLDGSIIQTYYTYLVSAGRQMAAKGANVVFSSPTPNNVWESGTWGYSTPRFATYAESAAATVGTARASYVDHGLYVANIYKSLGANLVNSFYPNDHTHTSPAGADHVHKAFVKGLLCAKGPLAAYVKNTTASVEGVCA